jgi:NADH-quinone oxidoreductase subunit E
MATIDTSIGDKVAEIISSYPGRDQDLMGVLNDIQAQFSYLPEEALRDVSASFSVPLGRIFSVATFYNAFSLTPKGKTPITVCTGTACHVKGAPRIIDAFERELSIKCGETTPDMKFSLEEVRCLGCCGLAPVITIGADLLGGFAVSKVTKMLKKYDELKEPAKA